MNVNRKFKWVGLVGIFATGVLGTGCGQNLAGTYRGTETVSISGMAPASSPVTVTITDSGNVVTGSISGGTYNGTFTASSQNAGTLTGVNLTLNAASTGTTGVTGLGNMGMCPSMSMTNGTWTFANNTLSGTSASSLVNSGVTGVNGVMGSNYGCSGQFTINVTKQ